ncbi:MAG: prenyltransferase [Bacteroidales bacterium]|nr:prenyltransferase [Bacteroidales bacterium]
MKKHTFGQWMIAVRPWSFPASAMPVIVTTAFLFWRGYDISWGFAIWALLNIIVFHAAGNTWSDYFDFKKKVDADDTFGAKTLTTGMFDPKEIKTLALTLTAVAVAGGLALMALTGLPLLWIGLGGVLCTLFYPYLKFNALGDLVILLAYAFLPTLGTSFVAAGEVIPSVLIIALPLGLITDGILHSNNTRDMATDARAGIRTMAMALGTKSSAILYGFEMLFPFLWIGVCSIAGFMPIWTVAAFMTLPVAIACAQTMKNSVSAGSQLIADLDVRTANLQLMFSFLLTVAFVVARFI